MFGKSLLPHGANAERTQPRARTVEIVGLHDHHVAALAAPLEVPPRGRARPHRRDELDELVAEREHRVVDAKLGDARIAKRRIEPEQLGKPPRARREVADDEDDLADAQHRELPVRLP